MEQNFSILRDLYFVFNLISDMLNYVVFVLVNLTIDVYMLIRLRQTLNEKIEKLKSIFSINSKINQNPNQLLKKELEMQESMNNAIRMVIVNSTLNFFFKLTMALVPLNNLIYKFYYQTKSYGNDKFAYGTQMRKLNLAGIQYLIPDIGEFLLTILISFQLFIFAGFDKKIKAGLSRFNSKSNSF